MEKQSGYRLDLRKLLGSPVNGKNGHTRQQSGKRALTDFAGDALIWIKSDPKYVSAVRALLSAVCAGTALSERDKDDLMLAVGEAVCNAIEHGSPCGPDDYIRVAFTVGHAGVRVSVSDCGGPFVKTCLKPDLKNPREGGYGLFLMRKLTNAARVCSSGAGTTVTLEKRFPVAI